MIELLRLVTDLGLMTFLMVLSVILLYLPMRLLSIVQKIRGLIYGIN